MWDGLPSPSDAWTAWEGRPTSLLADSGQRTAVSGMHRFSSQFGGALTRGSNALYFSLAKVVKGLRELFPSKEKQAPSSFFFAI
jgi:hypothetical protein